MSAVAIESLSPQTLLEQGHLDELLWLQARSNGRSSGITPEHAFYAGIAAHHLGLREPSRAHFSSWARVGGHHASGALVSIVVTDDDGPDALRSSLEDIVGQIYRPLEVVIVTSPSSSQELIDSLPDDIQVRHIESPTLSRWHEKGAREASGEWLCWLAPRETLYPHHVGHLIASAAGSPRRVVRAAVHASEKAPGSPRPSIRALPSGSLGRHDALTDDPGPLCSMLVDSRLARQVSSDAEANEWDITIALCQEGPIESSHIITSSFDADRKKSSAAARLRTVATMFHRHLPQSIRLGGATLHERQRARLRELTAQARASARRAEVVVVLVTRHPERVEESTRRLADSSEPFHRPGERSCFLGPEIVAIDPSLPHAFERFRSWCQASSFDIVAVVEDTHASSLEPGWLTSAIVYLQADPSLVAASPQSTSMDDPADALIISGWRARRGDTPGAAFVVARERLETIEPAGEGRDWNACWNEFFASFPREPGPIGLVPVIPLSDRDERPSETPEPPLVVLCYHRVVPERNDDPFGIAVSRATFARHLERLRRDYRVIHSRELEAGTLETDPDDPRTRVLITIDDGYRDTYEVAAPLLVKARLPFVVFVTTGAVSGEQPFWWEVLERSSAFAALSEAQAAESQEQLRFLSPDDRQRRLAGLELEPAARAELDAIAASWPMVRELHDEGVAAIGAHTRFHSSLGKLEEGDVQAEVGGSFSDIEAELGERPRLFAFPHGSASDVSDTAVDTLIEQGCRFGFTTLGGAVPQMSALSPGSREAMTLPRLVIGEIDADTLAARIDAYISPTSTAHRKARKLVVTSGITAHNIGDDAMLVATVQDLKRLDPNADIVVLAEDPSACVPVQRQIGVPVLRSLQLFIQDFLKRLPPSANPAVEIARLVRLLQDEADTVIAGGGSRVLPEDYLPGFRHLVSADGVVDCGGANLSAHWKSYFYEKCVDYFLSAKPLFVLGQGVDRFADPFDQELLIRALGAATEVTTREIESETYLSELGIEPRATTTADDALTIEAAPLNRRDFLLRLAGVAPREPYLAFQFRHYLDYSDDRYLTLFALLVDETIRATGLPVVGVPMHFSHTDERRHLEAVFARAQEYERTHVVSSELTASDAKSLFAGAEVTFGISYHSAILSLSAGTPFIGLFHGAHYEQKMKGLAALYEMPSLAVSLHATLPSELGKLVADAVGDRPRIRTHLLEQHERLEALVVDSRTRFLDAVEAAAASRKEEPEPVSAERPPLPMEPLSRDWGFDRGLPVDRFYIERFLADQAGSIRGDVAELLNDRYARRFGGSELSTVAVVDIDPENPNATIVADLTRPGALEADRFDCFVLTQTLPYIHECGQALGTVYASLKPNGTLLITVPSIIKYHREPEDHWRFTPDSISRLIRDHCPHAQFEVNAHGNLMSAIAFLSGMATEELDRDHLLVNDPEYPVVVTARVTKRT